MALARRLRSSTPLLQQILGAESTPLRRSAGNPSASLSQHFRNYATDKSSKEANVKVPLSLFGVSGNYASALFLAASKANLLDKVQKEILDVVEASKKSPVFSQFIKDLSVPADVRVKAMQEIFSEAGFSDVTKNFLGWLRMTAARRWNNFDGVRSSNLLDTLRALVWQHAITRAKEDMEATKLQRTEALAAENGRLRHIEKIAKSFVDLTMAHKGEVKVTVTTVISLPAEEEKELKQTLQDIIGHGKTVNIEQKVDPSILGGLVVEFGQKVFDMSIKTRAKQMERFLRDPINFDSL